ncbi:hypothetical protein, partial [Methyloglobulus sp.]|uniref:hypothetical protein n=1 Tax=Methyloglobulus sp. TaxID=2518622 RepID=UPI003989D2C5
WLRNDSTRCRNALHFHYAKKRFVKTPSPIASGDYSTPVSQRLYKKLKRERLLAYFANLSSCLVGMEACGGSHPMPLS